jgi:hypothetical protein
MKVFNPGQVPVVVDDGAVVPASEHADIVDGPVARAAVDRGALLDQTEPDVPAEDATPRSRKGA